MSFIFYFVFSKASKTPLLEFFLLLFPCSQSKDDSWFTFPLAFGLSFHSLSLGMHATPCAVLWRLSHGDA